MVPFISMSRGRVIMRDGKIATEQECCCCPCYVIGPGINLALCFDADDPATTPELVEELCGELLDELNCVKAQFENAGYTATLRQFNDDEIGCSPSIQNPGDKCGWELSISCDECAAEWFEPFYPDENPNPDSFCILDGGCGANVVYANLVFSLPCPAANLEYPAPGSWLGAGSLIDYFSTTDSVQYIPCCGNPLP